MSAQRPNPAKPHIHIDAALPGPGKFSVQVVGASSYQEALELAAGGRSEDGVEKIVDAVLLLEDSNPHDPMAVQILIGGYVCGYLGRENAKAYREQLRKAGHPKVTISCKAKIVGGWDRGHG